ncbi:MAG TPA: histidine kinase [Bacteroidota bacterium]|nr:histidine kinase [Bacteroidota bacterium]
MKYEGRDTMIHGEANPFRTWKWKEWLIVFGASTGIGLLFVFQNYLGMSQETTQYKWNDLLVGLLSYWYVWALLFPFIIWLARYFPLEAGPTARNLGGHIPAFIVFPLLHIALYALFLHAVDGDERPFVKTSIMLMKSGLFFRYLTYAFLLAASYSIDYYRQHRERELRTSRLEAKLAEAQLQSLKSQIHPHFLFNTLNAISSLMHKNVEAADEAISRLADLLRATLEANGAQEVPLRQELELLKQYVGIEKLRLGERLIVRMEVQEEALEAMVPNLLLQPIVENAIRYGVSTQSRTGTVTVSAGCAGTNLEIRVTDDGPGLPDRFEEGIGIANTKARLRQLYGMNQSFLMSKGPSGGVCVTLQLPLRTDSYEPSVVDQGQHAENPDAHR